MGVDRLQREVTALRDCAGDLGRLRAALDGALRRAVGHDVAALSTVDPSTLLLTSCFLVGADYDPERERRLFELEFHTEDVNQYATLAAAPVPAAGLALTVGNDRSASLRAGTFLPEYGLGDELRAVFRTRDTAWGTFTAYRWSGQPPFTASDVESVAAIAGVAADLLRLAMLDAAARSPGSVDDPPGMLLLSADGDLMASTAEARHWLDLTAPPGRLPAVVTSVVTQARLGAVARASVPTSDGRWVVFHAAPVKAEGAGSDGAVSVIVEGARPVELSAVVGAAYGLTRRERTIVSLVARGRSTAEIARELAISAYTVQDHLKSVFAKTGARTRGELVATLYAQQYEPRNRAGARPGPYGWFLDDAVPA